MCKKREVKVLQNTNFSRNRETDLSVAKYARLKIAK